MLDEKLEYIERTGRENVEKRVSSLADDIFEMNVMETVTVKFVARTVDKLVIYFTTIKSEALLIHEFWEKKLVKGYIAAKTRRTILPKLKIEEWNIYNKTIKQAGA